MPSTDVALADLKEWVLEIREILVRTQHAAGDKRAGARSGPLILGKEKLIRMEEAVDLVWGADKRRDAESRKPLVSILEDFATIGIGGVVLETTEKRKHWHTSEEAVDRFMRKAFPHRYREWKDSSSEQSSASAKKKKGDKPGGTGGAELPA